MDFETRKTLLFSQLMELGDSCNQLTQDTLNYGGCGVYAYAVGSRLRELGWRSAAVVAGDSTRPSPVGLIRRWATLNGTHEPNGADWVNSGLQYDHILTYLRIGREQYLLDSNGIEPLSFKDGPVYEWTLGYRVVPGKLWLHELRELVEEPGCWNCAFPRGLIPDIYDRAAAYLTVRNPRARNNARP